MAKEIERKFTVDKSSWNPGDAGVRVRQGYLPISGKTAVRVRVTGDSAWLTIKGENKGPVRSEFEYPIPLTDAHQILDELCERPFIEKTRYLVNYAGATWEVDVFDGENAGLIIAEIELASENQKIELPPWVLTEVTDDPRYYNANLIKYPFKDWLKAS
ncbi:MAG: CYTH domain-containing protein [Desulfobacteraceae bacterium]|nr:CYTH domain-containing protein [Desulfobacteraceae bacterium]MBC2755021.1 CYTH domain-containing protein [Desulfobacteraceae bacterium]